MRNFKIIISLIIAFIITASIVTFYFYQTEKFDKKDNKFQEKTLEKANKNKYQEYIIDSLKVTDNLENLASKVINLFGRPRGVDRFSKILIYEKIQIKIYKDRVYHLPGNFKACQEELEAFREKHKDREEKKFMSYTLLCDLRHTMGTVIEYASLIVKNPFDDEDFGHHAEMLGIYLGEFINKLNFVVESKELTWLLTFEEVKRKLAEAEEEMKVLGKERARQLEEKFFPPPPVPPAPAPPSLRPQ